MALIKHFIPVYRPIVYVIAILIILLQFYVIWEDRQQAITWVEYSYSGVGGRMLDSCYVDVDIKYVRDVEEAQMNIADRIGMRGVVLHNWKRIYKNK